MNALVAAPEAALAGAGLLLLLFGVLARGNTFRGVLLLTLAAFAATAAIVVLAPPGTGFEGQFVSDPFSVFTKLLILAGAALALTLATSYNAAARTDRFEYPLLVLFATTGMLVMCSANNFITLYLGLELQSLAIYVLAAFERDRERSAEAGLKYFILGALASGLLLYGISLIYGFTGSLGFGPLTSALTGAAPSGLVVGIVFVIAGLAFKLSAAPFHMWTPDVYEGAPTPVTAFLATAPKVAAIALLLRTLAHPFGHLTAAWQQVIVLISLVSMVWGALAALGQKSIKRLMAYSAISHMGYALIGLAAATPAGVRGVLIYMTTYVAMSAGTFAIIIAMRRQGQAVENIEDLAGLARTNPGLALTMAIFMFSMAGIPPLAGFFGKLYVFLAAVQAGLWTLAVVGVLTSVLGAFYYLRVIKVMYMDQGDAALDRPSRAIGAVAAIGAAFTLFFALFSQPLISAAEAASHALMF